jgi:DNA-binding SARP family transcriptional activator/predicted ATPase
LYQKRGENVEEDTKRRLKRICSSLYNDLKTGDIFYSVGEALMSRLSIWLLGPFKAELDGEHLSGFRSEKVRALLSYLAVEAQRPWGRSTLADLLWPDFPEQAALSNLRNALSNLRRTIGDLNAEPPLLEISQETIQFNPSGDSWLDVKTFLDLVPKTGLESADQVDIERLEQAFALYRGDFMEGFTVASAPFEEWVLTTREQLRGKLLQVVQLLALAHERTGNLTSALDYTRSWIDLDPWDEAAYRHRMQMLARSGQRNAALSLYEELSARLAQELGVAPEPETVQLCERVRSGQPVSFPRAGTSRMELEGTPPIDPGPLPQYLVKDSQVEVEFKLFVARQKELKQLESGLERGLQGDGAVYFVTGEPGSGKTTLLAEFSCRAMQKHNNLIVLWGQCNAYTGQGDPYFPFLNITRMLAGDVESLLSGGVITLEHAGRLWKYLPDTLTALLDYGPDLIGRFLLGGYRPSLVQKHPGVNPDRLEDLHAQLRGRLQGPAQPRLQQAALLEQFAQVVTALSQHHPLVIILDDLQWIDPGSVNLLFHLGRRLGGSKMLLLGAYRSEEVSLGREGASHPLEGIVQEMGAMYGEIQVDLMQSEGAAFVDALLDSEPNALKPEFRHTLYQRTSGHPLFTIELLRGMQLRGELIRDRQGKWVEGLHLNWEDLPAKVEAVIARRICHLPDECQELLNVACVEGEQFTGEVLARVMGRDESQVHDLLSQEIGKRHRLVAAQGLKQIGEQRLSTYRFRHSLFQTYLYNHLDILERSRLHGNVGNELEKVYQADQEKLSEFSYTLARHFETGGIVEKAVRYYNLAGKNALRLSASQEALAHFYHAIHLMETLPASAERDRKELELQLSLGPPLTALKGWAPPEMAVAYERAQELCQYISDHSQLIPALWLLSVYRLGRSEHTEVDLLVARLFRLAQQASNPDLLSLASLQVSPFYQGKFSLAKKVLERVSTSNDLNQQCNLAQQYGMAPAVVGPAYLAECLWFLGFPIQADQYSMEARELAEAIKHPMTSCYAISRSCWLAASKADLEQLHDQSEKLYRITQRYGFKNFEFAAVFFENWAQVQSGMSATGRLEKMYRLIEAYHATGTVLNRTAFLVLFGLACAKAGQIKRGLVAVNNSIGLAEKTGELWYQAEAYRVKGELLARHETDISKAENCFLTAHQIANQQGAKMLELRAVVSLYKLRQRRYRGKDGREILAKIYNSFTEGFDTPDLQTAKALLDN